jgi:hypothetical protein
MVEVSGQVYRWHRPMLVLAFVMAGFAVVSAVGLAVDQRVLLGAPIWLKPLKFALSIAAYCLAWSWLFGLLRTGRRLAFWVSNAIVLLLAVEYAIIVTQVVRGRPSHFNVSTPLDAAMWSTMGFSITALWLGTLVLTVQVLRAPIADPVSRWAVRLGTVISLVGLALGFLMVGPTPGQAAAMRAGAFDGMVGAHSVGVPDGGPGLPLTGWSTTGGDLRIPHFVGMHALQALPLLAVLLEALARRWPWLRPPVVRSRIVISLGAGYAGLLALVTWQAERGQPLIRPDALTLTGLGVLLVGVLGLGGYLLRGSSRAGDAPGDRRAAGERWPSPGEPAVSGGDWRP